jgi:hypothetical protein
MFYFNELNYLPIREGVVGRKPKGLNNRRFPYAIRFVGILLSTT